MVSIPIVTLDKIFIRPDEENIFFLDCTRINGTNEIISRKKQSIYEQIKRLGILFKGKEIIIADDVVFSGGVLRTIINMLEKYDVKVVLIIASITSKIGYDYFNRTLKYGLKANYIMNDDVIDQVCERDFYFGVAGSGIMIKTTEGYLKAPYFLPYGNPNERASIPVEFESIFSKGCLERSLLLWESIDKNRKANTLIKELPEEIIKTNKDEEVVKTLRKEFKKIWENIK